MMKRVILKAQYQCSANLSWPLSWIRQWCSIPVQLFTPIQNSDVNVMNMFNHAIGGISGMTIDGIYHISSGHLDLHHYCWVTWFSFDSPYIHNDVLLANLLTYSTFWVFHLKKEKGIPFTVWDSNTNLIIYFR